MPYKFTNIFNEYMLNFHKLAKSLNQREFISLF